MTTPKPDAKTVADKLTSVMFVEGYVGKENLEAVNFLLNKTLTQDRAATLTLLRERVVGLRVGVPEATRDWNGHTANIKALAHNNALDQALQVIEETLTPNTPD